MWKLKELKLVNFMSHKDSTLLFPDREAHMIVGINKDDDGQESNGSGKSVANEAIALAITGTALRKTKDCDLIHYGEEEATVSLTLINQIKNREMVITRTLFTKSSKSSILDIYIDGQLFSDTPTVKDGNAWILDQIGVSREDLLNYYLLSERSASFFTASDTVKKQIVSRFSNTDVLIPIREQIKEDGKKLVAVREGLNLALVKLQERKLVLEEQRSTVSINDAEKIKQGRLDLIQNSINGYNDQIEKNIRDIGISEAFIKTEQEKEVGLKAQLDNLEEAMDYTKEIQELRDIQQAAESDIADHELKANGIRSEIREFEKTIGGLLSKLESSIECPECKHNFVLRDKSFDLVQAKEDVKDFQEGVTMLNGDLKTILDHITGQSDIIRGAKQMVLDFNKEMSKSNDEKDSINRLIRVCNFSIKSEQDKVDMMNSSNLNMSLKINEANLKMEEVKAEKLQDPSIEINKSIALVENQIQDKDLEIDAVKDEIVKANEFEAIFVKFMTNLSNKAIKAIEGRVNNYLEAMGSNLSVQFEGYKVLSTGQIRENITIVVLRNGAPEAFFENFSKGERGRINIAGILALNELLNSSSGGSHLGCGLDFVCLDEAMDGIDSMGVGFIMNAINDLGQPILAVSHIEPKEPFRNTIACIKENGVSRFENKVS